MEKLEIKGVIIQIMPPQQVTDNFTKREFVLETPGQYPQKILFQTVNKRCEILDNCFEGQNAVVAFNIRGRESNGKFFNQLEAWKIN
jgi:hypothetical protein